ncbi:unnamed protein product [Allacma fusca]|uniref:Uncharacterized protein n=1 Tax=Allacma fusca TaxID=39272 RepID=A0A8J2K6P9_9HEXA|nr:unnamed protein product [Allacma fusca]
MKLLALFISLFLVGLSYAQTCDEGWVQCEGTENECVREDWICDGEWIDCSNGWDETGCPCPPGQVQCPNSTVCIYEDWICDQDKDCPGGEDEEGCPPCSGFECESGRCIPGSWECDGEWDCENDESNCTCSPTEFKCDDGLCIPGSWECDDYPDCRDRSDEGNCTMVAKHGGPTKIAQISKDKARRNQKKIREDKTLSSCSKRLSSHRL